MKLQLDGVRLSKWIKHADARLRESPYSSMSHVASILRALSTYLLTYNAI